MEAQLDARLADCLLAVCTGDWNRHRCSGVANLRMGCF